MRVETVTAGLADVAPQCEAGVLALGHGGWRVIRHRHFQDWAAASNWCSAEGDRLTQQDHPAYRDVRALVLIGGSTELLRQLCATNFI